MQRRGGSFRLLPGTSPNTHDPHKQAQAGWLQHDLGHLSVFKSRELNLIAHRFVIIHLKAASSAWWNYRHYLHHAKPNIAEADPGSCCVSARRRGSVFGRHLDSGVRLLCCKCHGRMACENSSFLALRVE